VKARGDWRWDRSVRRYEKHARLTHTGTAYPGWLDLYLEECEKHLEDIFLKGRPVPLPPQCRM